MEKKNCAEMGLFKVVKHEDDSPEVGPQIDVLCGPLMARLLNALLFRGV